MVDVGFVLIGYNSSVLQGQTAIAAVLFVIMDPFFCFTTAVKAVVGVECTEDRWRQQLGIEPRVPIDQSAFAQGTPSSTATDGGSVAAFRHCFVWIVMKFFPNIRVENPTVQLPGIKCSPHMPSRSTPILPTVLKPVSARRCLFPSTTTAEERFGWTRQLEQKFLEQERQQSILWGFDFHYDRPLENDGLYSWEMVPEDQVPAFYRTQVAVDGRSRLLETDYRRPGTRSRLQQSRGSDYGNRKGLRFSSEPRSFCTAIRTFASASHRGRTSPNENIHAGSTQSHINNFFPVSKMVESETDKKPRRGRQQQQQHQQQQQQHQQQSDNGSDSDDQQNGA
ncbi:Cyclin-dependent kinase inhibitor 1 [Trichinella nativa]|uniref:Cyclin-dependent kinase inhibitor 1 n=1 Tax=Trichinella nativa TaxID=6335 RepID=A0A0V1L818_9BILA|nr:Cyclin-dependent kinase inhibitor 1 [Trichinella nativa]